LKRLPKTGDVWPEDDRKLWLQLLEGSFLIYKDGHAKIPRPPGTQSTARRKVCRRTLTIKAAWDERGRQLRRPYFCCSECSAAF
jgi:hypothetical protein